MDSKSTLESCELEVLFPKHFPHIIENIFFSMDYKTYTKCREVCSTWNKLLTSDTYQRKEKYVFRKEIWQLQDDLLNASRNGQANDVIKLLRIHVLDVESCGNRLNKYELSPLHEAALRGHNNVVKVLIEKGANPNKADQWGMTPLWKAVVCNHANVVKLLLEKGANPNDANEDGLTPLHYASYAGHKYVVKALLEAGANQTMTDSYGRTPAELALLGGHTDVVLLLSPKVPQSCNIM